MKRFIQRGRQGWGDEDVWSFDNYLAGVIAGGVGRLVGMGWKCMGEGACVGGSCPKDIDCEELWNQVLRDIRDGFQVYHDEQWDDPEAAGLALEKAMPLFVANFGGLWW